MDLLFNYKYKNPVLEYYPFGNDRDDDSLTLDDTLVGFAGSEACYLCKSHEPRRYRLIKQLIGSDVRKFYFCINCCEDMEREQLVIQRFERPLHYYKPVDKLDI